MMKTCPACGAEIPISDVECSFCGSRITPVSLSFEQREKITQLIHDLNQSMLKEKKRLIRQTDLISSTVWLIGIIIIWIAGMLMNSNSLKTGMLAFSAVVLFLWWSYRRKRMASGLVRFFKQKLEPEIVIEIDRLFLPRWQFDQLASRELNENDPLHKFVFFRSQPR